MTITIPNSLTNEAVMTPVSRLETRLQQWKLTLLASAIIGGICWFGGMAIGLLSLVGALVAHPRIDRFGTALLVAAFPLIIMAAHCLDRAHEVEKAITIEYCRRTGMTDQDAKTATALEL